MNDPHDIGRQVGVEVAKAAPPVLAWVMNLQGALLVLSVAYVAMQIAYLAWKWRREWKRRAGP